MIGTLVDFARGKAAGLNVEALAPRCAGEACPGNRARWHGLLRRSDGVRVDGMWYCGPECLRRALESRVYRLLSEVWFAEQAPQHRMPLGLVLLSRGVIRHEQLQTALCLQRSTRQMFGRCLCELGFANEDQVVAGVAAQWSCPVYPVHRSNECRQLLPRLLQEHYRISPMHWVSATRDFYVAFTRGVNHTLLYSIERMLSCHTIPCFIRDDEMAARLQQPESESQEFEIAIHTRTSVQEICGSAVSYAQQVGAEEVRLLGCGAHLWIRLLGEHRPFDLLFRRGEG